MAYQSWSVVFGEQPSAAKWNILGTNDASFNDGTGIADGVILPEHLKNGSSTLNTWVWDTWTPTLSGRFDDGDWTKTCRYIRIGNTVVGTFKVVASAAAPMGGGTADCIFTLPVTATVYQGADQNAWIGGAGLYDSGTTIINGATVMNSANLTTARIRYISGDSVYSSITSTAPFTWTTNDEITTTFMYQAAA